MKWIVISGSWRIVSKRVEKDVRKEVRRIIAIGNGIIDGGAPGVDYIATDEALKIDRKAEKIKVYLPSTFNFYIKHTRMRIKEGFVKRMPGEKLMVQLAKLRKMNKFSIIEGKDITKHKHVERWQYHKRNGLMVKNGDGLMAFHVNNSVGTADAIGKAKKEGIPTKVFSYKIRANDKNSNEGRIKAGDEQTTYR